MPHYQRLKNIVIMLGDENMPRNVICAQNIYFYVKFWLKNELQDKAVSETLIVQWGLNPYIWTSY